MTNLIQRARDVAGRLLECHEHNTTITFYGRDERNPDGPEAAAIIAELIERVEWQDIETAPKGVPLLVCEMFAFGPEPRHTITVAIFDDAGTCCPMVQSDVTLHPTHWMPLPPPPSVLGKQEGEG